MHLPRFLYELYPVVYIVAGIAAMYFVASIVAFISGLILGISGTMILFLRRNYRAVRQQLYSY